MSKKKISMIYLKNSKTHQSASTKGFYSADWTLFVNDVCCSFFFFLYLLYINLFFVFLFLVGETCTLLESSFISLVFSAYFSVRASLIFVALLHILPKY